MCQRVEDVLCPWGSFSAVPPWCHFSRHVLALRPPAQNVEPPPPFPISVSLQSPKGESTKGRELGMRPWLEQTAGTDMEQRVVSHNCSGSRRDLTTVGSPYSTPREIKSQPWREGRGTRLGAVAGLNTDIRFHSLPLK